MIVLLQTLVKGNWQEPGVLVCPLAHLRGWPSLPRARWLQEVRRIGKAGHTERHGIRH